MESYKLLNLERFQSLIENFEEFCKVYEYCLIDYNLINNYFQTLINQKIELLYILNSFIFTTFELIYEDKIIVIRKSAEKILNQLLNNLVIIYKKKIYYNGYNVNTSILNHGVLPYNIVYNSDYDKNRSNFNISNLIFF